MNINKKLIETLSAFPTISLDQLNSTMSFLDRIDVKYIVHGSQLPTIIKDLQEHFFILSIKENSIFSYDNVYMDTKDFAFYNQHQQGEKTRTKIRTRHYVDAGDLVYFEFKQKHKATTRKFRYEYGLDNHGKMTNEALKFYEGVYVSMYGDASNHIIFPSIGTRYKRFTLCSKTNDERVTIDFAIELIDLRNKKNRKAHYTLPRVAIIESKSTNEQCLSHQIMAKHGIEKADACSKYCLGMYYHGLTKEWSKFQPTINKIEAIKKAKDRKSVDLQSLIDPYTRIQTPTQEGLTDETENDLLA